MEVQLGSTATDVKGFVIDYASLDSFKQWIAENLDHRNLNEVFSTQFTTAEFLAEKLYDQLKSMIRVPGVKVDHVRVKETEDTYAEYLP